MGFGGKMMKLLTSLMSKFLKLNYFVGEAKKYRQVLLWSVGIVGMASRVNVNKGF